MDLNFSKELPRSRSAANSHVRRIVREKLELEGFVVADGIKYGLDFLVYTDTPEKVHSKYAVLVNYPRCTFREMILAQRTCNSNKKILLIAHFAENEVSFMEVKRFLNVNSHY